MAFSYIDNTNNNVYAAYVNKTGHHMTGSPHMVSSLHDFD